MKKKFIKVTTWGGETVWLNSANIVAITESKNPKYRDTMVILTNAVDKGEGQYYLVPGSPEVLIGKLGEDIELF